MATIGNVTIRIGANANQLQYDLKKAERAIKQASTNMQALGERLSIGLTAPLALAGGAAFKMASDVEESLNKVRVAFGDSAGSVEAFAETTLNTYGIARGTALDMSALFGDMATAMGLPQDDAAKLSTSLVGLAGDLASFKNISLSEVQTALSGIFTGETESLKRLGIVMTEANVQAFALEQGITKKFQAMSQAEKVALRYNYVLTQTKNAQGDFARTSDGAANQMRIFQESLKELGASFGQVLLPVITPLIQKVNEWIKSFKELSPETKKVIVIVAGLAAAIGPALIIISQLITAVGTLQVAFFKLKGGLSLVSKGFLGLNPTTAILAAIAAAIVVIIRNWDEVVRSMKMVANVFIDIYNNSLPVRAAVQTIAFIFKEIYEVIKLIGNTIESVLTLNFTQFTRGFERFGSNTLTNIKDGIKSAFGLEPLEKFDTKFKNTFKDVTKLPGLGNLLGQPKAETVSSPVGVLAPKKAVSGISLPTGGGQVRTLTEQISDLKKNIDALSIAYSQKPSSGVMEQLNAQIDKLKQKESVLQNAEDLVTRLTGGGGGSVELLPKLDFSGALNTIKTFAQTSSEEIRAKTNKGLLDGLKISYSESGFSTFIKDLETDLTRIGRQFDDGIISGVERNASQFDTLFGSLQNLQRNGFGKLSPEVLHVKGLLDEFGGFEGFSDLFVGLNKVTNGLKAVGESIGLVGNMFTQMIDSQIAKIDAKEQNEIQSIKNSMLNEETKQKMISEVEAKADKKRKELQRKQAIAAKALGIFNATIATFQAVTQALTVAPPLGIALAGIIGAMGAANIAAIASAPLPSLAIGTDYVKSDGMAYLHKGEAVVPADVVGGGFSRNIQLYSIVRGDDIYLTNKRAEYNKSRTS